MFSEETLQCENYTEVVCGTRYEPKWECKKTLIFTNTELRVIFTAVNSTNSLLYIFTNLNMR